MAEIKPIRPWRYDNSLDIRELTSPLFDVVSENQLKSLYQNPLNSIHLSVPQGPNAAQRAGRLLDQWKKNQVLRQDKLPAIYVYYQYFRTAGSSREYCRKGFVVHIRAYDWEDQVILRHENTIPKSVNDRVALLKETQFHASPTHGLYTDEKFELERHLDEAISAPVYETQDYQGVRDVLAPIQDAKVIQHFIDTLKDKTVILADGHHRYESSLIYKHERMNANPLHTGREGYNFHLMYLTNTEAGDLLILPTHRLIRGIRDFDPDRIIHRLKTDFDVKLLADPGTVEEAIKGKRWAFGILLKDRTFLVTLHPESFHSMTWHFPEVVRALDLTVLHYFIIEKVLDIPGREQRASEKIDFDRSFSDCLTSVLQDRAQMAIITGPVSIDDVKKVCRSGSTMPQKSTYFYPKVICGFLFSSILEDEFQTPPYSRF